MIRVFVTERLGKTAEKLPQETRNKATHVLSEVGAAFGNPHQHRGLGLRKLAKRSYEIRVDSQWRIVFIHEDDALIAYDIMNHDEVSLWLRRQRK